MANFETALRWMREGYEVHNPDEGGIFSIKECIMRVHFENDGWIRSADYLPTRVIMSDKWEKYVKPLTDGEKEGVRRLLTKMIGRGCQTHSQVELWRDIERFAKELGVDINDI